MADTTQNINIDATGAERLLQAFDKLQKKMKAISKVNLKGQFQRMEISLQRSNKNLLRLHNNLLKLHQLSVDMPKINFKDAAKDTAKMKKEFVQMADSGIAEQLKVIAESQVQMIDILKSQNKLYEDQVNLIKDSTLKQEQTTKSTEKNRDLLDRILKLKEDIANVDDEDYENRKKVVTENGTEIERLKDVKDLAQDKVTLIDRELAAQERIRESLEKQGPLTKEQASDFAHARKELAKMHKEAKKGVVDAAIAMKKRKKEYQERHKRGGLFSLVPESALSEKMKKGADNSRLIQKSMYASRSILGSKKETALSQGKVFKGAALGGMEKMAGIMEKMAGGFAKLLNFASGFAKFGGIISAIVTAMFDADAQVKEFVKTMFKGAEVGTGFSKGVIKDIQRVAINADDYAASVRKSLGDVWLGMGSFFSSEDLVQAYQGFASAAVNLADKAKYSEATQVKAVANVAKQADLLGKSYAEVAEMHGKYMKDNMQSLQSVQGAFDSVYKAAVQSGIGVSNFYSIVQSAAEEMTIFGGRIANTAKLLRNMAQAGAMGAKKTGEVLRTTLDQISKASPQEVLQKVALAEAMDKGTAQKMAEAGAAERQKAFSVSVDQMGLGKLAPDIQAAFSKAIESGNFDKLSTIIGKGVQDKKITQDQQDQLIRAIQDNAVWLKASTAASEGGNVVDALSVALKKSATATEAAQLQFGTAISKLLADGIQDVTQIQSLGETATMGKYGINEEQTETVLGMMTKARQKLLGEGVKAEAITPDLLKKTALDMLTQEGKPSLDLESLRMKKMDAQTSAMDGIQNRIKEGFKILYMTLARWMKKVGSWIRNLKDAILEGLASVVSLVNKSWGEKLRGMKSKPEDEDQTEAETKVWDDLEKLNAKKKDFAEKSVALDQKINKMKENERKGIKISQAEFDKVNKQKEDLLKEEKQIKQAELQWDKDYQQAMQEGLITKKPGDASSALTPLGKSVDDMKIENLRKKLESLPEGKEKEETKVLLDLQIKTSADKTQKSSGVTDNWAIQPKFAGGGYIGGKSPGGDSFLNDKIPALLSKGEYVVPRSIASSPSFNPANLTLPSTGGATTAASTDNSVTNHNVTINVNGGDTQKVLNTVKGAVKGAISEVKKNP